MNHARSPDGPLANLKVIEICTTIAGPACARLLADFGADVIKIEPPDGDPVRQLRGEAHPAVQVKNCDLALAQGTGGNLATRHGSSTLILERE